ncbi:hypothetical protein [Alloalcanivorax xenomutans]|uniref:hypothetical protein n=1 Tax=Alloalcanivorax xenomutans TaxID=1094342 RepID=UPI0024E2393C|nr:hypothetical protein [Alloalcanivorax xenomutans]
MRFHHNANAATPESRSECGLYRTRTLRLGLLVAERRWHPGEKPQHLYAPWRFLGFAKDERQARHLCRQARGPITDARAILRDLGLVALANGRAS